MGLLRSRAAPDARWLLLGLASTVATFWLFRQTSVEPLGAAASVLPPLGFVASAGLGTFVGMRHALEPDHLAAVSTLMTGERSSASAAWLGACWGLGHTLTLLTAGALLVVLEADMPAIAAQMFELGVVLLLVAFGVRAIYQGARRVPALPTHSHRRSRALLDRWTVARPLLVGAMHGLAGSGALTAVAVTRSRRRRRGLAI